MLETENAERAVDLQSIPVFARNTTKLTNDVIESGGEPIKESPEYEYEFSCTIDGHCSFIGLYDSNDVSACERITHRPVKAEEIAYSDTGNGFINDNFGLSYTFTKQHFKRSWESYADIKAGVKLEAKQQRRKTPTAADVLASL